MRTRVYCLASAKGGSGKTVLCASFASFLVALGKEVLIIDVDSATHGLTLLYLNEVNFHREDNNDSQNNDPPIGVFDTGDLIWGKSILRLPNGVSLLPATFSFSIKDDTSEVDLLSRLKFILNEVKEQFDYIFLDAQAGTDNYSQIAMRKDISHEVVIVSEYDPLSAAGVERLKAVLRDELSYERTWVLLNKLLPEFVDKFSEFLEVSKYLTPIPWDADVVRAFARRRLPLDLDNGNQFTLAVMQSLKKLLGEDLASEIEKWAEGRASNIREPVEEQYQDAEKELRGLLEWKTFLDRRTASQRLQLTVTVPLGALLVFMIGFFLASDAFGTLGKEIDMVIGFVSVTVALTLIIGLVRGFMRRFRTGSAEQEVEEARFARQFNIIQERLEKLEVLRKADLETLVKDGSKLT